MSRPFLEVLPREIRDQIYTHILTTISGTVGLSPWSIAVAQSLSILRTCKQIHREVKDIIWANHDLRLPSSPQIAEKFAVLTKQYSSGQYHLEIDLEMMDRDELQWILHGLRALTAGDRVGKFRTITLRTVWERPRGVGEYKEVLMLRRYGKAVDGRLYQDIIAGSPRVLHIITGWPRFSHWGKQKWLKQMLLDPSGVDQLLKQIHEVFGGELHVDGVLCFKGKLHLAPCNLDPRDGEVRVVPRAAIKDVSNRNRYRRSKPG